MKVCIVSDSHDRADALTQAVGEAKALGAEAVIHCGDLIGAQSLKPALALGLPVRLSWPRTWALRDVLTKTNR